MVRSRVKVKNSRKKSKSLLTSQPFSFRNERIPLTCQTLGNLFQRKTRISKRRYRDPSLSPHLSSTMKKPRVLKISQRTGYNSIVMIAAFRGRVADMPPFGQLRRNTTLFTLWKVKCAGMPGSYNDPSVNEIVNRFLFLIRSDFYDDCENNQE